MAFTIGSGTFTNGSATVTGVTLTSGTLAYFASGTRMVVGVNPVIQEVEAIAAPTVSTITLRSAWTGTGGTYSFLANQTSEGLRDAVQAIRTNNASLQSFIDSIDTAATADSVAQRTSDGSLNAVNLYATGNLGVGTASPAAKLSIAAGDVLLDNTRSIIFKDSNGDARSILQYFSDNSTYLDAPNGNMVFRGGAGNAERARIDTSGNVGIGGTPTVKLTVRDDSASPWVLSKRGASELYMGISSTFGASFESNDIMRFATGASFTERMRIDSSGNVLVGKTSANSNLQGIELRTGFAVFTSTSNVALISNRKTSDGAIHEFQKDGTQVGSIGASGGDLYIGSGGTGVIFTDGINALIARSPSAPNTVQDNVHSLGWSNQRWAVVYAATGSINTSDAREKTPVEEFTADELNAAKQLSKEIGTYKFLSAVAKKGDDARKHIGMTVQRAIEIMEANNLDPFAYGFICYDAWEEKTVDHAAVEAVEGKEAWTETVEHEAEYNEDGEVIKEAWVEVIEHEAVEAVEAKDAYTEVVQEAGDRYSFRPDEMLFFIARGLEARIEALEG